MAMSSKWLQLATSEQQTLAMVAVSVLAITIVSLWGALQRWRSREGTATGPPLPPGRLGLPLIGETLEFLRGMQGGAGMAEFVAKRVAAYGEVFKTSLMGDPTVVLSHPAGHKLLFTGENRLVQSTWPHSVITVLGRRSLSALKGDDAKRMRQAMVAAFFRPEVLQRHVPCMDARVRAFVREEWEGKDRVSVYPLMKDFLFSLACDLVVSRRPPHDDAGEERALQELFTTMVKGLFSLPVPLPGTAFARSMAAARVLRSKFQAWIDARRVDLSLDRASPTQDLLSCLLTYRHDDGTPLPDEDIKDNILLLLFAGHDTTTVLATFMCKYLAANPPIFDEVFKENKDIAARKHVADPLNWTDIQNMKLSWRVVQETLRIRPPIEGSYREALQDFEIDGFTIPKGWKIFWTPTSTHWNTKYFPDPFKFDPSRFDGTGFIPYTFLPFGGGPRMCIGNEFARMEVLVLLHHLVTRFRWKLVDPHEKIRVDPMPIPTKGLPIYLEPLT